VLRIIYAETVFRPSADDQFVDLGELKLRNTLRLVWLATTESRIAQYFEIGNFLFPNNLPANAHGNGYSDPNVSNPSGD
jgi:hypothetical protein